MAFASVPVADFVFTQGEDKVGRFASSAGGERLFCAGCGTPLLMRNTDGAGTADFSLATLDHPARVAPGFHLFYASRIPWAEAADDLPRHDRYRRDPNQEANSA